MQFTNMQYRPIRVSTKELFTDISRSHLYDKIQPSDIVYLTYDVRRTNHKWILINIIDLIGKAL